LKNGPADQPAITIDSNFKLLIANPSPEEFSQLEANILRDGCREPLSLWDNSGKHILIDGHNRYEICQKHNLPSQTTVVDNLPDRDAVMLWIEERQLGRRNLTDDQRSVIADSIRERRSALAKRDRAIKGRAAGGDATPEQEQARQNRSEDTLASKRSDKSERTRAAVAREARVPERKLRTVIEIRQKAPELVSQVRAGLISLADAKRQVRKAELNQALNSVEAITTFDIVNQCLMVDFDDPADLPKKKTTFDIAVEELTVEYPSTEIGTTQVMNGVIFKFNGKEWIAQ
jgi:ParB-like chromosome segregation protein Spo0J